MLTRLLLGCVLGMALVTFSPGASVNAQEKHGNLGDGFGGFDREDRADFRQARRLIRDGVSDISPVTARATPTSPRPWSFFK